MFDYSTLPHQLYATLCGKTGLNLLHQVIYLAGLVSRCPIYLNELHMPSNLMDVTNSMKNIL